MRILVLTSVYKDESLGNKDTSTNIVNSFVKEWVLLGHEVIVVHNAHCYPKFIHKIPSTMKKKLAQKMGFAISDYEAISEKMYEDNGAKICRVPIKKYIPHSTPSAKEISKQVKKIVGLLEEFDFVPDVITGHWASPQMELISELKLIYNCKTAIVLHGTGYIDNKKFDSQKYLMNIDYIGARSRSQAEQIQGMLDLRTFPFVCNSGVPDSYLLQYSLNLDKYKDIKKWKFTYVGRLVAYKNIDSVIKALSQLDFIDWEFNIVGEGAAEAGLKNLVNELYLDTKVKFWGKVPRNQVMEILSDTHCFIMISTNEIFGLVYLEAMAASCITVASKNGGVDGIIVNNTNGFLCNEGNAKELYELVTSIVNDNPNRLRLLAKAGYETAHEYSDSKVARRYLDKILQ